MLRIQSRRGRRVTKVTVICGGSTPERNVALAGAGLVTEALRQRDYRVDVVDTCRGALGRDEERVVLHRDVGLEPPTEEELEELRRNELTNGLLDLREVREADVLFLVLHGRQGEGGQLQSLFELEGLRFVGSDSVGSVLAMDKDVSKRLFQHRGVPTPAWAVWPVDEPSIERLGLPLVVKPSRVGSTVGLTVVRALEEIEAAVEEALLYDDCVLLEQFVEGREFTVGVLGNRPLAVGEILPQHEIFDYACKYTEGMCEEVFPADIPEQLAADLRTLAMDVHFVLKLRDFSRVDFRVDPEGRIFCLEANTLPGMGPTSLLPQSAATVGVTFPDLCNEICRLALAR